MKQNDNNDVNSVILSNSSQAIIKTDFELRLINDTTKTVNQTKKSSKPATKPRKYV